jgi:hypothetical protein
MAPMQRAPRALIALTAWAMAVPWLAKAIGQGLDVPARLEVVDHVVPGLVALAAGAVLVRADATSLTRLVAGGVACLAGVWITAAHAVLVPEAIDGVSPWGAALLHLSAGPPITVVAAWMLLVDAGR